MADPLTLLVLTLVSITSPLLYLFLVFSKPTSKARLALVPAALRPPLKQYNRLSVLLVIAHPDDECMFFAPTILQLVAAGAEVGVLCLSQGNADGLGTVRRKELTESCKALGIHAAKVHCLDHAELQDNPKAYWKAAIIAELVKSHISERKTDVVRHQPAINNPIITFDKGGVSGHENHKDLCAGVRSVSASVLTARQPVVALTAGIPRCRYLMSSPGEGAAPKCYSLTTVGVVRKYLSVLDVAFTVVQHLLLNQELDTAAVFIAAPNQIVQGRTAMRKYKSQMVWFRHLYILFSRYMVVNELRVLNARRA
ncbi:hypothetical protein HDU90_003122 [Geranomyces variabilis]|nr:hypothetical protein HDU90_003122 [Geranomyces variabilis]